MRKRTKAAVTGWLGMLAVVLAPAAVFAQASLPPAPGAVASQASPTPAAPDGVTAAVPAPRGLFGDFGKLFDPPPLAWPPPAIASPAEVIEGLNARARDAGQDLSRLGRGPVVTGRARCPVAANGAPDCQAAADLLCRDKGFKDGRTADVEAAQVCSPRALLSGRTDEPGACRMENYVTRAMCQ